MNELQIFENEEFKRIRTIIIDDELWFVGRDLASNLGYSRFDNMLRIVDSSMCKNITPSTYEKFKDIPDICDNTKILTVLNECGLMTAIQRSSKITQSSKTRLVSYLKDSNIINSDIILTSRKEIEFLDSLGKVLEPFGYTIEKQKIILAYRLDAYIEDLNIVIEYDENGHSGYDEIKEKNREYVVKTDLNCEFIRVSDKDSDLWNVGYVLKKIFEIKNNK